jgi:hypothetical protein
MAQRLSERLAVDEQTRDLARLLAAEAGLSISEAVREALAEAIARRRVQGLEAICKEGLLDDRLPGREGA